jgi:hypothetical protein
MRRRLLGRRSFPLVTVGGEGGARAPQRGRVVGDVRAHRGGQGQVLDGGVEVADLRGGQAEPNCA